MIVIGIAPGLKALSYSVINTAQAPYEIIDKDVLLGPRVSLADGLVNLGKKAYAHELVLGVVFERHIDPNRKLRPPVVLALGPPCNPKEDLERPTHVMAVRLMITALCGRFGLPLVTVTEPQILAALSPARRESWQSAASRQLSIPLDTGERKLVLAVVIGLTGQAVHAPKAAQ